VISVTISARRKFPRTIALASIAVTTGLLLAACAPSTTGPLHHTAAPHHGGQGGTPSATPSPTAVAVAPPQVRIPLTCSQLISTTQLNSVLGATLSPIPLDASMASTGIDPDLTSYIAQQDGALNCAWSSPVGTDGNSAATYYALVMPDATAAWNSSAAKIHQYYSVKNPLGANTWSSCWVETLASAGKDENCGFDVLLGSTWLTIGAYTDQYGTIPTLTQVFARFKPLFQATTAVVKPVSTTEPAWSDPQAAPVTFPSSGGAVAAAGLGTAVGSPFGYNAAGDGPSNGANLNESFEAEVAPTNWHADNGGNFGAKGYFLTDQILPEGSWAFSALEAADATEPLYSQLTGVGTEAFMYGESDPEPNTIVIVGVAGDNLYTVEVGTEGKAGQPVPAVAAKAAAAYIVSQIGG
jgi:hypothetical protein